MRRLLMRVSAASLLSVARPLAMILPFSLVFGPAVSDVLLCLIAALFLAHSTHDRQWQWLRLRWVQLALALGIFVTARNFMLNDGGDSGLTALAWLRLPLFAVALSSWVLPDNTTERWMLRGLALAVAFMAVDSLWQFHHGTDLFGRMTVMSDGYHRLTGPFKGPRVGLSMVWLLFPAAAGLLVVWPGRASRFAAALLLIITSLAIYVSGERMAFVALILGFGLAILFAPRLRPGLLLLAAIVALLGWTMAQTAPQLVARQVNATHSTLAGFWDSVYGRTWISVGKVAFAHPLFGVGMNGFKPECDKPDYGPSDAPTLIQRCALHPHNMYLSWLMYGGFPALILFSAMAACWMAMAVRHWRRWWGEPVATALLITLAIRLLPIALAPNQQGTWVVVPLWLVAGWWLATLSAKRAAQSGA